MVSMLLGRKMPNVPPKSREELEALAPVFDSAEAVKGFVPNSILTMAHVPQLSVAFSMLANVGHFSSPEVGQDILAIGRSLVVAFAAGAVPSDSRSLVIPRMQVETFRPRFILVILICIQRFPVMPLALAISWVMKSLYGLRVGRKSHPPTVYR